MIEFSSQPQPIAQHILIVDDDPFVREVLEIYLSKEGFQVVTARGGGEMRDRLAQYPIALVLMDVRMPGEDGFTLTRHLRAQYNVGVIIITTRHETVDRVVGLECGADDYIIKPFEEREVLARIRSVLRRTTAGAPSADKSAAPLAFHGCVFDPDNATIRTRDRGDFTLTANEARLLAQLVRNAGRIQGRDELTAAVLQREWSPLDRSIDVLVTRLRQKIEHNPRHPTIIKTVRGAGYVVPEARTVSESAA